MVALTSNEKDSVAGSHQMQMMDPMGQAGILLVESLIHRLVARRVIGVVDAVELVGVAIDVLGEQAFDAGELGGEVGEASVILERIRASLAIDLAK